MNDELHIGKLIQDVLTEGGRAASWLAKRLNCDNSNIYRIFKNPIINTYQLLKISQILDYDFFAHYSSNLRANKENKERP
jgi:hypothetical protein